MADPLALLSLAIAAAGGRLAGHEVGPLVAAGHTLLQRSAGLVRALAGRRTAILLPPDFRVLTALAASDGRGALLIDPSVAAAWPTNVLADALTAAHVGALFTTRAHAAAAPAFASAFSGPVVWLDDAPARAVVAEAGGERVIDLGSHFGLDLAGDSASEGLDEECLSVGGVWYTHRALLAAARTHAAAQGLTPMHWTYPIASWSYDDLIHQMAILLQGGSVVFEARDETGAAR
jgi:hypothetical protein